MKERQFLQVPGKEFMEDPILDSKGVLADVSTVLPLDQHPVRILQVRLNGRGPDEAKLTLTIQTKEQDKAVVECPVRVAVYDIVRKFFERKSAPTPTPELADLQSPAAGQLPAAFECAERVVRALESRRDVARLAESHGSRDKQGIREAHAYAVGDAVGIAVLLGDEPRALALADELKKALRIVPGATLKPTQTRLLLNSIAPIMRAASAAGRPEVLLETVSRIIPDNTAFGALNESSDTHRFSVAVRESMEHLDGDQVKALFDRFRDPNLKLHMLSVAVDACIESSSAQGLKTCGRVARKVLQDCHTAEHLPHEVGLRIQAFVAAFAGDIQKAEELVDHIPRWYRGDELLGWIVGFTTGAKLRAKHDIQANRFLPEFKNLLYHGNEDYFEVVASSFAKGLLAANQGAQGDSTEAIFQLLSDTFGELEGNASFTGRRFVHHLVAAQRAQDSGRVEQALQDFSQTCSIPGSDGDALVSAMCEELLNDVAIRDRSLRLKVVDTLVTMLKESAQEHQYELTRLQAGDMLYLAGYERQALQVKPPLVIGEAGRLVWTLRSAAFQREFNQKPLSALFSKLRSDIDTLAYKPHSVDGNPRPLRASDWCPIIEESAAVNSLPLARQAFVYALRDSASWPADEVSDLSDALLNGLVRRAHAQHA